MNWIIFWIEFSWNNFELNKLLNWIFMIQLWIEYWIESILGKIQTLNWINLGIEQGYPKSSNGLNLPLVCLLSPGKCQDFNGWWWTNQIFSFCLAFTLFCQECFWQFKMIKFNSKMMEWLNLVFFFFHLYLPGELLFKI